MTIFQMFAQKIRSVLTARTPNNDPFIVNLSIDAAGYDPLIWMARQPYFPKFFWRDPIDKSETAFLGSALVFKAQNRHYSQNEWAHLNKLLMGSPEACFIGGMSFQPMVHAEEWKLYGGWCMYLPLLRMRRDVSGATSLSCQLYVSDGKCSQCDILLNMLLTMVYTDVLGASRSKIHLREETPSYEDWEILINKALREIRNKTFSKVVLSRRSTFRMEVPQDPFFLLKDLLKYSGTGFLYQPAPYSTFLGTSPELLFHRKGRRIETSALAGTRSRGDDTCKDNNLRRQLLNSAKDKAEHKAVVIALEAALKNICVSLKIEKRKVVSLAHQMHLSTSFLGELKEDINDTAIIAALYPTPAVAGSPQDKAMAFLAANEAFDRGWFSGNIGIFSQARSCVAAAIRSCLLHNERLHVYGGAGIVPGSKVRTEWEEIDTKMKNITDTFYAA